MADGLGIFTFKNKRHMPGWLAWCLVAMARLYNLTMRRRVSDPHDIIRQIGDGKPVVIIIWHNRSLMGPLQLPRRMLNRTAAIVSASRDGEYMAAIVRRLGMRPVRGSSTRGGAAALVESVAALKDGYAMAVAVDGPRGPKYCVHPGAAHLGQHGFRVVPFGFTASRYWQFRSWDNMQVPKPFATIQTVIGDPIEIAPDADQQETCQRIKEGLLAVNHDRQK